MTAHTEDSLVLFLQGMYISLHILYKHTFWQDTEEVSSNVKLPESFESADVTRKGGDLVTADVLWIKNKIICFQHDSKQKIVKVQ